jgi:hypothetical protein
MTPTPTPATARVTGNVHPLAADRRRARPHTGFLGAANDVETGYRSARPRHAAPRLLATPLASSIVNP